MEIEITKVVVVTGCLEPVFKDGKLLRKQTLSEIRSLLHGG
jgi:hypothetical protein